MDRFQTRHAHALNSAIICIGASAALAFMMSLGAFAPSAPSRDTVSVIAVGAGNMVQETYRVNVDPLDSVFRAWFNR